MIHLPESSRPVVTGIGMVCSLGRDRHQIWTNMLAGKARMERISLFDPGPFGLESCIVAEVADPDLEAAMSRFVRRPDLNSIGRFRQFALAAAAEAIEDAALVVEADGRRIDGGCILGTMCGGAVEAERITLATHAGKKPRPSDYLEKRPGVALQEIARTFHLGGPMFALDAACASGSYAITQACHLIAGGRVSWCLAGGVEASLVASNLKAVNGLGAICKSDSLNPSSASRPFDVKRSGYIPAEGACFLVVEDERHACNRGVRCYARIAGFAEDTLSNHATRISHDLAESVMRRAIDDAGLDIGELGWIKAHATSTRQGDKAEALAIDRLTRPHKTLCSAPKSVTGHLLGASGAFEAAFSALSLHEQVITPTINLDALDSSCPVNCVRDATSSTFDFVLANSWGFGGSASSTVFGRI